MDLAPVLRMRNMTEVAVAIVAPVLWEGREDDAV
jgi:hypothetical protein